MKDLNNIEVIDHEIVKPQEDIVEETRLQCLKCFKPPEEIADCSMCNGFTRTKEDIKDNIGGGYVFFEG